MLQGRLILYGQQYRPRFANGAPIGLPVLKAAARSRRFFFPYWRQVGAAPAPCGDSCSGVSCCGATCEQRHTVESKPFQAAQHARWRPSYAAGPGVGIQQGAEVPHPPGWLLQDNKDMRAGVPAIHVRAPSSREPRRYLDAPSFSNCTLPIVFYQHNPFNFAHGGWGWQVHAWPAAGLMQPQLSQRACCCAAAARRQGCPQANASPGLHRAHVASTMPSCRFPGLPPNPTLPLQCCGTMPRACTAHCRKPPGQTMPASSS